MRFRILDLFCGAGGCAVGYCRAAIKLGLEPEIYGVDKLPMQRYPYDFIQGDVMNVLEDHDLLRSFDFVHASPPCQAYSVASSIGNGADHPRLIEPTQAALRAAGVPYVIENVESRAVREVMNDPVMLCGSVFERDIKRHRLFECSHPVMRPRCRHEFWQNTYVIQRSRGRAKTYAVKQRVVSVFGRQYDTKLVTEDEIEANRHYGAKVVHVHGASGGKGGVALWREVMGIDWMTATELREAIPPDYTELLGLQLFPQLASIRSV